MILVVAFSYTGSTLHCHWHVWRPLSQKGYTGLADSLIDWLTGKNTEKDTFQAFTNYLFDIVRPARGCFFAFYFTSLIFCVTG